MTDAIVSLRLTLSVFILSYLSVSVFPFRFLRLRQQIPFVLFVTLW